VCTRVKRDVVTWLVGIVTVDKQTDVYFYVIQIITVFSLISICLSVKTLVVKFQKTKTINY